MLASARHQQPARSQRRRTPLVASARVNQDYPHLPARNIGEMVTGHDGSGDRPDREVCIGYTRDGVHHTCSTVLNRFNTGLRCYTCNREQYS